MRTASFALAGLVAGALSFAPAASFAQSRSGARAPVASTPLFDITPYAGYMVFGDFLSGPLGTSLSNAPAPIYGAQLGMKIAPNVSMIGNLAAATSDIKIGVPILGGLSVAHSSMVFYDAGLQLDIPVTSAYGATFSPFVQAGVGGMHYDISQSLVSTTATNLAGNIGAGADIAMGRNVGLRLMAKDYIGKFDFQEATSFDVNSGTTHNIALSAGLRFSF
ncbi:MAG: hypothetical protein JWL61_2070 [Gemmatimonadetes bacterium]|nr:hypothetical protein [Gemmatimonadota bacterium]